MYFAGMRETQKKMRLGGNNRGYIAKARAQALKDISAYQFETAPDLTYPCSRNEAVGYYCWTATQLSKDRAITHLNRRLGI